VIKHLKAQVLPDGINIGLMVSETQAGATRAVSVHLSQAEFGVVIEMCRCLIPQALGMVQEG
jgi:hypothetical protein